MHMYGLVKKSYEAEKVGLEAAVAELTIKLEQSEEKFSKADSLSAEVAVKNAEFEQKLKSLEELLTESKSSEASALQKIHEFEELLQTANSKLEAAELKDKALEEQVILFESKHHDTDRELREHVEKLSEFDKKLLELEPEKEQVNGQTQGHRDRAAVLEPALDQATLLKSELEEELKNLNENSDRSVSELELLLETEKNMIKELEEEIETLLQKFALSSLMKLRSLVWTEKLLKMHSARHLTASALCTK